MLTQERKCELFSGSPVRFAAGNRGLHEPLGVDKLMASERNVQQPVSSAKDPLDTLSINTIRTLSMDAVQQANSGHPGTPMALAPVAYVLWQDAPALRSR